MKTLNFNDHSSTNTKVIMVAVKNDNNDLLVEAA